MKQTRGFTIIELMAALVLVIALIVLGFITKNNFDASARDTQRKTAVNAFYYGLKQGYFKQHKSYPASISHKNLPYVDKQLFTDPAGRDVSEPNSDYHYEAKQCDANACKAFEISTKLEKEARYTKSSGG